MITGYNHNIKYKDQVCHVQTEDSGVDNPHIITHLFVGGNIIESRKVSYADILGQGDFEQRVVTMMQGQHKEVLKLLIKGQLDEKLAIRSVNAAHLDGPAPLNVERGQNASSFGMPSIGGAPPTTMPAAPPVPVMAPAAVRPPPLPVEIGTPLPPPPPSQLDDGGLLPQMQSSFFGSAPPPKQIIEADVLERAFESNDESAVDSIFGEDLISEKSLDEVILSYLAEDMQK